ncbi:MAG: fibronectin type III-like domain-contianing protein, partial [Bacteroidales bacterium]|nr:fibronectin type III-like domain-contianing protein [Bacteroidales bacterium]
NVSVADDKVVVKVHVKNTGKVAGRDVVEVYTSAPKGKLNKPAKELKGFAKTSLLQPGASETVTVEFNVMDMASFSEALSSWTLDKGDYSILVSRSVNDVVSSKCLRAGEARANKVHNAMSAESKSNELKK